MQYAKNLQAVVNQFGGLADPLLGANPPADMAAFRADLKQAEELLAWEASQATEMCFTDDGVLLRVSSADSSAPMAQRNGNPSLD